MWRRGLIGSNRGELASGWYSLITQEGAAPTAAAVASRDLEVRRPERKKPRLDEPKPEAEPEPEPELELEDDESEDEVVGPFLPGQAPKRAVKSGPAIPTEDDLHLQRGTPPPRARASYSLLYCVID